MSDQEPTGPRVYQPKGMQDKLYWAEKRIYGVGGVHWLANIDGLTKSEAEAIVKALEGLKSPEAPA